MTTGASGPAPHRLAWLTDVAPTSTDCPATRHPSGQQDRSNRLLGRILETRLGPPGWWVWAGRVAYTRHGGRVDGGVLSVLARALGAPEDFFALDRAALPAAQHSLVTQALAGEPLRHPPRSCRNPASSPRPLTERTGLLHAIRSQSRGLAPPRPGRVGSRSSSDSPDSGRMSHYDDGTSAVRHGASSGSGAERRPMPVRATEADLELFCTQLVSDYDLALPLDPWELCRRVGSRRGRPVRAVAADLGGPHSVGHLIALPDRDSIFYDSAAPRPLQVQVLCHELMHLLRGHLEDQPELTCGALLPHDSPTPAPTSGGLYATWQEWEAEVGATLLARFSHARPQPSRAPDRDGAGLAAAFGLQQARSGAEGQ